MARRDRIQVVVADDHPMFREGVARAIKERPDLELVAEAGDGREAVAQVTRLEPDVALFDLRMPGLEGEQALEALRARSSSSRVLILSAYSDGELVHSAVRAGARGFLSKRATRQEICDAIVRVARGELFVDARVEGGFLRAIQLSAQQETEPILTARELQVLGLTADGSSTKEIAGFLHLSRETVKTHLSSLYSKLDVSTRAAAVAVALRRGLLD